MIAGLRAAGAVAIALSIFPAAAAGWPAIAPQKQKFGIMTSSDPVSIDMPILTPASAVAYVFTCRSFPDDPSEGVPAILCTLNEYGGDPIESTLLGEDGSAPWHTRGHIVAGDLLGECASYPQYGARRTFRLRGMRMELTVSEVASSAPNRIDSLALTVAVRPDSSATGEQAAQTGYLHPGGKCRPIRTGNHPRMCRNWENARLPIGSWFECSKVGR